MSTIGDPIKDISEIRSMMERSSKFLSLSGLAGVSAGACALLGAAAAYWRLHNETEYSPAGFLMMDALIVLVCSVGLAIFFTTRMAKKKSLQVWNHTTKYLLAALLIPLVAGKIFIFILWYHGLIILIVPSMLLIYGFALINTSKYALNEVQYLGIAEIVLGLLTAFFLDAWLIFWAIGFGVFHIVYGIYMYFRYEQ